MERLVTYAQNREDMILHVLLNKIEKGFYCDVGAYHPSKFSVTKFFYEKGWHGINIEPNKSLYKLFVDERKRDINLNIGISNKNGKLHFRSFIDADGLSSFSESNEFRHESLRSEEYDVKVKTLKKIFRENGVMNIDFLKVDVEGLEKEVLEGNDWKKFRPKVVVVEVSPGNWELLLRDNGYNEVYFDGLNRYFVDKAMEKQYSIFDYAGVLLSYGYFTEKEICQEKEIRELKSKIEKYKLEIDQKRGFKVGFLDYGKFFFKRLERCFR